MRNTWIFQVFFVYLYLKKKLWLESPIHDMQCGLLAKNNTNSTT